MAQELKGVPCHLLVQMGADDGVMRSLTNCSLWMRQKLVASQGESTCCHLPTHPVIKYLPQAPDHQCAIVTRRREARPLSFQTTEHYSYHRSSTCVGTTHRRK